MPRFAQVQQRGCMSCCLRDMDAVNGATRGTALPGGQAWEPLTGSSRPARASATRSRQNSASVAPSPPAPLPLLRPRPRSGMRLQSGPADARYRPRCRSDVPWSRAAAEPPSIRLSFS